ncbi:MAG TPA: penicillin-binding transpeptidase domain-containing protein [Phycisphaerae bacterium]|nr:penicillin-binding transpeptidase domain-containing protein [Phycisphaerae bacterium]
MFERRLKVLLILLAVPTAGIVLRLVQMQALQGDYHQATAEKMMRRQAARYFPCLRGEIQDHEGRRLAFDAPAWDICVRYEVIADDARSLRSMAKRLGLPRDEPTREQIRASWQAISELTGTSMDELQEWQERTRRRVHLIKEQVSRAHGIDMPILEERIAHPAVRGLDQNQQAAARVTLAAYPWIEVVGGHRRQYAGGESLGHLLGYLNEVDERDIRNDPAAGNDLARYRLGDLHGAEGVEAMAESWLRGLRGRQLEDIEGRVISAVEPVNGRNFRLTLDLPLQQFIYAKLKEAVAAHPPSTGASAVVLDIPSRQILALVSYPGFDPNLTPAERRRLEADELNRPTKFRAVAERYPPGSIVKPVVLAGGWTDGKVNLNTRVDCQGQLNPVPPYFKCTARHPHIDPVSAIQHSCNVFFYRVGEWMEVPRLSYWLGQAGLGRLTGSGLAREVAGTLPKVGNRGEARLTAIGQQNVWATPLQAANMIATIASGVWRPVTLWADDPRERKPVPLPVVPEALRVVREGMYRVVNEPGGTAYTHIHLENTGDLVLLGKTGSAETQVGAIVERIFVCRFPDGSEDEFVAANEVDLYLKYPQTRAAKILERRAFRYWPTEEMDPTHAWFAGYLTARDRYLESSSGGRLNVALVVLIEFGGRGGGVAAPVAGEIVQEMINMQGGTRGEGRGARGEGGGRGGGASGLFWGVSGGRGGRQEGGGGG